MQKPRKSFSGVGVVSVAGTVGMFRRPLEALDAVVPGVDLTEPMPDLEETDPWLKTVSRTLEEAVESFRIGFIAAFGM